MEASSAHPSRLSKLQLRHCLQLSIVKTKYRDFIALKVYDPLYFATFLQSIAIMISDGFRYDKTSLIDLSNWVRNITDFASEHPPSLIMNQFKQVTTDFCFWTLHWYCCSALLLLGWIS